MLGLFATAGGPKMTVFDPFFDPPSTSQEPSKSIFWGGPIFSPFWPPKKGPFLGGVKKGSKTPFFYHFLPFSAIGPFFLFLRKNTFFTNFSLFYQKSSKMPKNAQKLNFFPFFTKNALFFITYLIFSLFLLNL